MNLDEYYTFCKNEFHRSLLLSLPTAIIIALNGHSTIETFYNRFRESIIYQATIKVFDYIKPNMNLDALLQILEKNTLPGYPEGLYIKDDNEIAILLPQHYQLWREFLDARLEYDEFKKKEQTFNQLNSETRFILLHNLLIEYLSLPENQEIKTKLDEYSLDYRELNDLDCLKREKYTEPKTEDEKKRLVTIKAFLKEFGEVEDYINKLIDGEISVPLHATKMVAIMTKLNTIKEQRKRLNQEKESIVNTIRFRREVIENAIKKYFESDESLDKFIFYRTAGKIIGFKAVIPESINMHKPPILQFPIDDLSPNNAVLVAGEIINEFFIARRKNGDSNQLTFHPQLPYLELCTFNVYFTGLNHKPIFHLTLANDIKVQDQEFEVNDNGIVGDCTSFLCTFNDTKFHVRMLINYEKNDSYYPTKSEYKLSIAFIVKNLTTEKEEEITVFNECFDITADSSNFGGEYLKF